MSSGLAVLTLFHVVISLVGIFTGFVVIYGLLTARRLNGWSNVFLITTVATSLTGYLFPFHKLLPSHILGVLSLIALAIAIYGYYVRRLAGGWRRAYAVTAVLAQYFNVFVLVAQMFMKIPALKALAPTQTETPFKLAQLSVLILFLLLGTFGAKNFSREQMRAA